MARFDAYFQQKKVWAVWCSDDWMDWQHFEPGQEEDIRADIDCTIHALLIHPALREFASYCRCCVDQNQNWITWLGALEQLKVNSA